MDMVLEDEIAKIVIDRKATGGFPFILGNRLLLFAYLIAETEKQIL